jgi:phage tail sheath gpL-like
MSSKDIAFSTIPEGTRKPGVYTEYNLSGAVNSLPANSYKVVVVGQRLAAGSVAANVVMDVSSSDDAATYFGRGSTAHLAVMDAIAANKYMSLQAVAVDDAGAGVAGSGTVTITGPATGSGALRLSVNENNVDIAIGSTDTATAIATALNAQIAAQPNLPITATVSAGVVTVTAKNKGTLGNAIKLSTVVSAAGVTATATALTGGLNDPDISSALTAIYNAGHGIIVSCLNDSANLTALKTHLNAVSGAMEKRRARAVIANTGTYSGAVSMASSINSGRILEVLVPNAYEASYEVAAIMAAIAASEPDPARPLNGMELVGLTPSPLANWLSETQIEAALHNGVTPTRVGPGNVVQIVRAVTTYTLNAAGVPDVSMLDWTTLGTLDYVANAVEVAIQLRLPRDKKTARTIERLRDVVYEVLMKCEDAEYIKNVQKSDILIEDDLTDATRTNTRIRVNVVSGMHVIAQRLDLIL